MLLDNKVQRILHTQEERNEETRKLKTYKACEQYNIRVKKKSTDNYDDKSCVKVLE